MGGFTEDEANKKRLRKENGVSTSSFITLTYPNYLSLLETRHH